MGRGPAVPVCLPPCLAPLGGHCHAFHFVNALPPFLPALSTAVRGACCVVARLGLARPSRLYASSCVPSAMFCCVATPTGAPASFSCSNLPLLALASSPFFASDAHPL
ncbi:hypothetical protein ABPG77_004559 [Micractinium sp. CCAP 211/92]